VRRSPIYTLNCPDWMTSALDSMLDGFAHDASTVVRRKPALVRPNERPCRFVGIDPGQTGYLAGVLADGYDGVWTCPIPTVPTGKGSSQAYDLPACWALVQTIPKTALVLLEKQQPYPGQGGKSNFSIGQGFMLWRMALTAAGLSFQMVAPQTWKKRMGIKAVVAASTAAERKKQAKAKAIALAGSLFPSVDLKDARKPKARTPSSDKAESLLLAEYARRYL